ncbi:MAG: hypothetical protein ABGY09_08150, partial [Euryarchaeota archaeon]
MIQHNIIRARLSAAISEIIEKHVPDPAARRYIRQMAERIVREITLEARRRGVGLSDLFRSSGWVVEEATTRVTNALKSIGVSGEDVEEDVRRQISDRLSLYEVAKEGLMALASEVFGGGEDEKGLEFYEHSEKVLDRLIEGAAEFVCLASPWVSDPNDLIEDGVRSLQGLPDRDLELFLLVASGENKPRVLRGWARLGFEVREAEGRRGELG